MTVAKLTVTVGVGLQRADDTYTDNTGTCGWSVVGSFRDIPDKKPTNS